jgi:hypothetical protein
MATASFLRSDLLSVARKHWRALVPVWLFPVFLFLIQFLPWFDSHPFLILVLVVVPAMTYCFRIAAAPLKEGTMSRAQYAIWAFLVPMLVWCVIVGGLWAVVA